jgi:hypothetical protein
LRQHPVAQQSGHDEPGWPFREIALLIAGLLALAAGVGAAALPWHDWTIDPAYDVAKYPSLLTDQHRMLPGSDIWGPPGWLPGIPFATVTLSDAGRRAIDATLRGYTLQVLACIALWTVALYRVLAPHTGAGGAALIAVGVSTLLIVATGFALGLPEYTVFRFFFSRGGLVGSTVRVQAEWVRARVEGRAMTLFSVALELVVLLGVRYLGGRDRA